MGQQMSTDLTHREETTIKEASDFAKELCSDLRASRTDFGKKGPFGLWWDAKGLFNSSNKEEVLGKMDLYKEMYENVVSCMETNSYWNCISTMRRMEEYANHHIKGNSKALCQIARNALDHKIKRVEYVVLTKNIRILTEKAENLGTKLDRSMKLRNSLVGENQYLKNSLDVLHDENLKLQNSLVGENQKLMNSLNVLRDENRKLRNSLVDVDDNHQNLKETINALRDENRTLRNSLDGDNQNLKETINALRDENRTLQITIKKMNDTMDTICRENKKLKNTISELNARGENVLREENRELQITIKKMNDTMETICRENQKLKNTISELNARREKQIQELVEENKPNIKRQRRHSI